MTTGAENDLKEASQLARRMVSEWGMGEQTGPVVYAMLSLSHASFFDEGTDITCLLCYPGFEIMMFHDLPGQFCLLASFLR